MADRKLTLLELHFDEGVEIGPKTVGVGGDTEEEEADRDAYAADDEEEDTNPVAVFLGLLALVVVAALARRLLGSDEELEIERPDVEAESDVEGVESAD